VEAAAASLVPIVVIAVRMAPDGVTSQLRIAPRAQAPSMVQRARQVAVEVVLLRLRHLHPQRRHRMRLQVQWSRNTAP